MNSFNDSADEMRSHAVTAVVLAGGEGRRMQGADKGWVMLHDRPLIEHTLTSIVPQVAHCLISANRNLSRYEALGYPVLCDQPMHRSAGPLAGVAAAMQVVTTEWLLCVPCDAPQLPRDLVSRLQAVQQAEHAEIVVAHDGKRLQPVVALLHAGLRSSLQQALANGERKVRCWYAQHRMAVADLSDQAGAFSNLNTPEELHRFQQEDDETFRTVRTHL